MDDVCRPSLTWVCWSFLVTTACAWLFFQCFAFLYLILKNILFFSFIYSNMALLYSSMKSFYLFIKYTFVKFSSPPLWSCLWLLVIFGDSTGRKYGTNREYASCFTQSECFYLDWVHVSALIGKYICPWLTRKVNRVSIFKAANQSLSLLAKQFTSWLKHVHLRMLTVNVSFWFVYLNLVKEVWICSFENGVQRWLEINSSWKQLLLPDVIFSNLSGPALLQPWLTLM